MERTEPSREQRLFCRLWGVEITPINKRTLLSKLEQYVAEGRFRTVVGHNLHSAYLYHTEESLRAVYDSADIIIADGKPIEVDARRALPRGSKGKCERIGSTDWIGDAVRMHKIPRIAILGTTPEANSAFVELVGSWAPDSEVVGIPGSDWSDERAAHAVRHLQSFNPDLVFIGLGMPLQEKFLHKHREQLPPATYALVGGAIDQLTGYQKNAPRWIGKWGLEWAWRLGSQPCRLAGRYLVEPWRLFAARIGQDR